MNEDFNRRATQAEPRPLPGPVNRLIASMAVSEELFTLFFICVAVVAFFGWLFS